jgi:glycerol-3-phosphate dehydrogenase
LIGMWLYDHLASHPLLPDSKKINLTTDVRGEALLPLFKTGFSYYDCKTDDSRLVILNALAAKEKGATILTHTAFLSAVFENDMWKIELKNNANEESFSVLAKTLVNVSGPWVAEVQKKISPANIAFQVELDKGSHIVVPKLYSGDFAYILQNADKRVVFAIPYQDDFTLIGTTDIPYTGDIDQVNISNEEQQYLCTIINNFFKKPITTKDIVWSYAGVRCLRAQPGKRTSDITRGYEIRFHAETRQLTVIGGKLTSFRMLADEVLEKLRTLYPQLPVCNTAHESLPGCDFSPTTFADFRDNLLTSYPWLPEKTALRYATNYGTRAKLILNHTQNLADLGQDFGAGLYQKEIEYLVQYEWAKSAEDILWRRSKLGLHLTSQQITQLAYWLAALPA